MVLIPVARFELTPFTPILQNIAVKEANTADKTAYNFHIWQLTSAKYIYFSVGTNNAPWGEGYSFFLNFIKFAAHLPNFKYKLKTNNPVIKADVEHFIKTGKRLSFLQKIKIELKNVSQFRRIITVLFLICIINFVVSALGYIIFKFIFLF